MVRGRGLKAVRVTASHDSGIGSVKRGPAGKTMVSVEFSSDRKNAEQVVCWKTQD